jgi:hypothetical protein
MTPKEKAEDLFEKFNNPDTTYHPYVHNAQQCALIAVDEILSDYKNYLLHENTALVVPLLSLYKGLMYWKEVKQEIEKL